ncbi:hypothetical protein HKX48_004103 [Thoreauomyces humboldtii]|nr:hypothetical protein HKX48_004103 [Thoreauomyces humboldtii]
MGDFMTWFRSKDPRALGSRSKRLQPVSSTTGHDTVAPVPSSVTLARDPLPLSSYASNTRNWVDMHGDNASSRDKEDHREVKNMMSTGNADKALDIPTVPRKTTLPEIRITTSTPHPREGLHAVAEDDTGRAEDTCDHHAAPDTDTVRAIEPPERLSSKPEHQSAVQDDAVSLKKQLWQTREERDFLNAELSVRSCELKRRLSEAATLERCKKLELDRSLCQEKDTWSAKLKKATARIDELETTNASLVDELSMMRRDSTELQSRCSVLGLEINRLVDDVASREIRVQDLSAELNALYTTCEQVTAQLHQSTMRHISQHSAEGIEANLRDGMSQLRTELDKKSAHIKALQSDIDSYRVALTERGNMISYLNTSVSTLQADQHRAKREAELESSGRLLNMRERMKTLVARMDSWRREEVQCVEECQEIVAVLNGLVDEQQQEPHGLRLDTTFINKNKDEHAVMTTAKRDVAKPKLILSQVQLRSAMYVLKPTDGRFASFAAFLIRWTS